MSMLSGHHLDDVSNRLSTLIQKAKKAVDDSKPMEVNLGLARDLMDLVTTIRTLANTRRENDYSRLYLWITSFAKILTNSLVDKSKDDKLQVTKADVEHLEEILAAIEKEKNGKEVYVI